MKKTARLVLTSFLVVLMLTALSVPALADDSDNTYVRVTSDGESGIYFVTFSDEDLIVGKTYTFSVDVNFGQITGTGHAFVNYYPYDTSSTLFGNLWTDWASSGSVGSDSGWVHVDYDATIPENFSYATMSVGFWAAQGSFSIDNLTVVDSDGNVVFSEAFDEGFSDVWEVSAEFGSVELLTGSTEREEESVPEELSKIEESQPEESEAVSEAVSEAEAESKPASVSVVETSGTEGSSTTFSGITLVLIIAGAVVLVAAVIVIIIVLAKRKK